MPSIGFGIPAAAIVRRETGRLMQERGLRLLAPVMLGVNALIAYSLLSVPEAFENQFDAINMVVVAQWLSMYAIGLVLIAGRAGTSIGTERTRDTWTLLRSTPAGPTELALGHMISAIASAGVLIASQLPILTVFALCAEDSTQQQLAMGIVIGLTSWIACAAWATWMSARFKRISVAFGATIAAALWTTGYLPLMLSSLITGIQQEFGTHLVLAGIIVDALNLLSPAYQFSTALTIGSTWGPVGIHSLAMLANIAIPFYLATRAIRHESDSTLLVSSKPAKKRIFRRTAHSDDEFVFDEAHSIYGLEQRATKNDGGFFARLAFMLIAFYVLAVAFFMGSEIVVDPESLIFIYIIIMGMTVWRSAIMITPNRETSAFDLIAMTGLRSHDIVRDLARASAASLSPILVLLLYTAIAGLSGFYLFEVQWDTSTGVLIVTFLATLIACMAMQLTCGLFASIAGRGAREAVVLSVILAFIMNFGLPLIVMCVLWSVQEACRNDWFGIPGLLGIASSTLQFNIAPIIACSSPIIGFVSNAGGASDIPRYTWFVSIVVGLAWTCLWYGAALWLMRRRLLAQKT